jgi:hypothetical protein
VGGRKAAHLTETHDAHGAAEALTFSLVHIEGSEGYWS